MLSYMAKTFFSESPVLAYPIFSLLLFLVVFVILSVKVWRRDPEELDRLARMPLDTDASSERPTGGAQP